MEMPLRLSSPVLRHCEIDKVKEKRRFGKVGRGFPLVRGEKGDLESAIPDDFEGEDGCSLLDQAVTACIAPSCFFAFVCLIAHSALLSPYLSASQLWSFSSGCSGISQSGALFESNGIFSPPQQVLNLPFDHCVSGV